MLIAEELTDPDDPSKESRDEKASEDEALATGGVLLLALRFAEVLLPPLL